ncbi:MAG: hypothetical protein KGV59_01365 [Tenacibaculum sp.]|nr:hypothetical protein [Tenacibaculum sp.]
MIVFYGKDFELNLTETRITLVEENPLFYNFFVKNYSWPFSKKVDDKTSEKLGFLDLENSANYNLKHYGKLLIDNNFEDAYFIITSFANNTLEGTIYYGQTTIELLDTPLNELPFDAIETKSITSHAKEVITKSYPEVNYNFPMVIDNDLKSKSKYEKFEGFVNQYKNDRFVTNSWVTEDGKPLAKNRNVLTPFPYLLGVLKTGFESAGMVMQGSFVSDTANNKLLMYTDKFLEKFSSELPPFFQFKNTSELWNLGFVIADYSEYFSLNKIGSYKMKIFFRFPVDISVFEFVIKQNDKVLYSSTENRIKKSLIINVKNDEDKGRLYLSLKLRKSTDNPSNGIGNIERFNRIDFSVIDGQLNEFPNSFTLAEIMPKMTFGKLLNKVKNWLNLEVTFNKNVVTMNYIESKFLDISFRDESRFELENPKRFFNQNKLYKLITSNESFWVGKNGVQSNIQGFRDEDITKIDMELEIMPIRAKNEIFTAFKDNDTNDFKLFLYDGLQNGLPVSVPKVANRTYLLNEIYERFWKKWLHFRLNSETYKDKFPVSVVEPFSIGDGRFKYGKKHLYKKIRKRRLSEEYWEVEIESETLG